MNHVYVGALLFLGCFLLPLQSAEAQTQSNSSIEVSINASSLFIDTNSKTHKFFFDGPSFSVLYSSKIIEYLDYYVELGALTAMDNNAEYLDGIFRFSTSIIHFDAGVNMYLVSNSKHTFLLRIASSIRNRKKVHHLAQIEVNEGVYFTYDEFINTYDYGGAFQLKYSYKFLESFSLGIKTGFKVYDKGESVLDAGLTIAKHF